MAKKLIKVYHSPTCTPCYETISRLEKGRFTSNMGDDISVELIDISTEQGFKEVESQGLEKIPTAKYEGKTCKIQIDEELDAVFFNCEGEEGDTPTSPAPDTDNPAPPAEPVQP